MPDTDFPTGQQISVGEIDQNSPITEPLMNKFRDRDITLKDTTNPFGGTGADGAVTITTDSAFGKEVAGSIDSSGVGTVTTSAISGGYENRITFSDAAHGFSIGDYITITDGAAPPLGENRRIVSEDPTDPTNSLKFKIDVEFGGAVSGRTFSKVLPVGVLNCTTFTLNAAVNLFTLISLPLIIKATTSITINGTISVVGKSAALGGVSGDGATLDGANGSDGSAGVGGGGGFTTASTNGGRGGGYHYNSIRMLEGGVGGFQAGSTDPRAGVAVPVNLINLYPFGLHLIGGAGGGGGGGNASGKRQYGGVGGGCIFFESPIVNINTGAIINVSGGNGEDGAGGDGAGGGGGGGSVYVRTKSYLNNGTVTLSGGLGGVGGNLAQAGGPGILIVEDF